MAADFDYGDFMTLTGEIEQYLGYLKGNETVADYLQRQSEDVERNLESWGYEAANSRGINYQTPPSEYSVDFSWWHWCLFPVNDDGEPDGFEDELVAGAESSWENGNAWAKGIGGYLRDLLADITRPDADLLQASIEEFSAARIKLEGSMEPGWTGLDFDGWIGAGSTETRTVVEDLDAYVNDLYLTYFVHAETIYAAACAITVKAQNGLNPMLRAVRDGLRSQLTEWSQTGKRPQDYNGINPLIPKIASAALEVIDLVPVVGEVKGKVSDAAEATGAILDIFGVKPEFETRDPFEAKSAEEVYDELGKMIKDDYLTPLNNARNQLNTDKAQPVLDAQNGHQSWLPPDLEGVGNSPMKHPAEP